MKHGLLFRFYLTGEAAEFFTLDTNSGQLKTSKMLDRETRSSYWLTAHVQDRERAEWECTSEILITLMDVNDNAPEFSQDWYTFAIAEDVEIRTIVGKIHAIDSDVGVNRKVRYSLAKGVNSPFTIDAESGIMTVMKTLDREKIAVYNVSAVATDLGTPSMSSTVRITVNIVDVNDNPPEFSRKVYHASVAENSLLGTEVVAVLAASTDVGVNAEIKYFIVGGNEHQLFTIDQNSGSVTLANQLDYERAQWFVLTIQVRKNYSLHYNIFNCMISY